MSGEEPTIAERVVAAACAAQSPADRVATLALLTPPPRYRRVEYHQGWSDALGAVLQLLGQAVPPAEAPARSGTLALLAERVRALPSWWGPNQMSPRARVVSRGAVLALLAKAGTVSCGATSSAAPDHSKRWETFGHVCTGRHYQVPPSTHECVCGASWTEEAPDAAAS